MRNIGAYIRIKHNMKEKRSIEDILTLVEQNFEFLYIGMFLSHYIKKNNLTVEAKNIVLNVGENKRFLLQGDIIRDSFSESFINWNQNNILGYFVEWNAFRGIAMAMHEGISKNSDFEKFLEDILKEKYKHFKSLYTAEIFLKRLPFQKIMILIFKYSFVI